MSFNNRSTISSSYDFQAHQQHCQRSSWFSQIALVLWFEVLPDLTPALPGMSPALPGAPRLVVGAQRLVAGSLTYSEGWQACPPRVSYSAAIDASKFTLHILSDTPGGFQWLKYILLMISALWKRHIDLPTKSITFNRCWSTMSGVPVLTIWRRHCYIVPFKAGTILTLRKFSAYYQLPINSEICAKPIFYASNIVRKSHFSAAYHNSCIIWEKLMSVECAEVSNWPHSAMHQ